MDSKSIVRKGVRVRVPPRALFVADPTVLKRGMGTLEVQVGAQVVMYRPETNQWRRSWWSRLPRSLVVIVVAPWRRISPSRDPRRPETRLLLGDDPKEIAEEEDEEAEGLGPAPRSRSDPNAGPPA